MTSATTASARDLALVDGQVILDHEIGERAPWSGIVEAGDVLTIVDLHGNQAVDTLFFGGADHTIRYSAQTTIAAAPAIRCTTANYYCYPPA